MQSTDAVQATETHARLGAALAGTWSGTERIAPAPWDPVGGLATARVDNRPALSGLAVVQDYEQRRDGATSMRGLGTFRVDAGTGEIVLHWLDTLSPEPSVFRGRMEGSLLVLERRDARGHARSTWDLSAPDRYVYALDVSPDGRDWHTYLTGEYTRDG